MEGDQDELVRQTSSLPLTYFRVRLTALYVISLGDWGKQFGMKKKVLMLMIGAHNSSLRN